MPDSPPTYVILLRAIGPATHKLMSMAQWRDAAERAGFATPETLVNTGNMIAGFAGKDAAAAEAMKAVLATFGLGENVAPIVRPPALLQKLLSADPIKTAQDRPAETGVFFFAASQPDFGWLAQYEGPETIHILDNHLIVDFSQDVAKSSRLIRLIDRNCGLNTARNWNSVRRIAERCAARESR